MCGDYNLRREKDTSEWMFVLLLTARSVLLP